MGWGERGEGGGVSRRVRAGGQRQGWRLGPAARPPSRPLALRPLAPTPPRTPAPPSRTRGEEWVLLLPPPRRQDGLHLVAGKDPLQLLPLEQLHLTGGQAGRQAGVCVRGGGGSVSGWGKGDSCSTTATPLAPAHHADSYAHTTHNYTSTASTSSSSNEHSPPAATRRVYSAATRRLRPP